MMHIRVLACIINADNLYETRSPQRIVQLLPTFSYWKFDDQVSTSQIVCYEGIPWEWLFRGSCLKEFYCI